MTTGCEDWDLWLSLLEAGYRGTIIPEVLFFYRRRDDSMSRLMLNGHSHARLFRRLVEKHEQSYRTHLPGLLREKDGSVAGLLREIHDLELEYDARLEPAARRAREELAALERNAARLPEGMAAGAQIKALQFEVEALRQSLSWRLTAPLRTIADKLLRIRGGRG